MKKIRVSHVGARNLSKIEIEVEEVKKIEIEKPKRTYKKREPKKISVNEFPTSKFLEECDL